MTEIEYKKFKNRSFDITKEQAEKKLTWKTEISENRIIYPTKFIKEIK